jgi:hypothetical protein
MGVGLREAGIRNTTIIHFLIIRSAFWTFYFPNDTKGLAEGNTAHNI